VLIPVRAKEQNRQHTESNNKKMKEENQMQSIHEHL
jgi:hypothetical protein